LSSANPIAVPVLQVRPNMLIAYDYLHWPNGSPKRKDGKPNSENFKGKSAYSGQLTEHGRKRLQRTINLLCAIAKPKRVTAPKSGKDFTFRVNFITLTLPQAQGEVLDSEIKKKCLDPWFKSMKRRHGLKSYVWRAERQFNGNVHFHITSDTWLPLDDIRDEWNHQLRKLDLISDFKAKHGHDRPNSTDVHAVWKINNIAGYMVKYMSKEPEEHLKEVNQKRIAKGKPIIKPENHEFRQSPGQPKWDTPIHGKVWDCSVNLKCKSKCEVEADSELQQSCRDLIVKYNLKFVQLDRCVVVFAGQYDMEQILEGYLLQVYREYLSIVRDWIPTVSSPMMSVSESRKPDPPPDIDSFGYGRQLTIAYSNIGRLN